MKLLGIIIVFILNIFFNVMETMIGFIQSCWIKMREEQR